MKNLFYTYILIPVIVFLSLFTSVSAASTELTYDEVFDIANSLIDNYGGTTNSNNYYEYSNVYLYHFPNIIIDQYRVGGDDFYMVVNTDSDTVNINPNTKLVNANGSNFKVFIIATNDYNPWFLSTYNGSLGSPENADFPISGYSGDYDYVPILSDNSHGIPVGVFEEVISSQITIATSINKIAISNISYDYDFGSEPFYTLTPVYIDDSTLTNSIGESSQPVLLDCLQGRTLHIPNTVDSMDVLVKVFDNSKTKLLASKVVRLVSLSNEQAEQLKLFKATFKLIEPAHFLQTDGTAATSEYNFAYSLSFSDVPTGLTASYTLHTINRNQIAIRVPLNGVPIGDDRSQYRKYSIFITDSSPTLETYPGTLIDHEAYFTSFNLATQLELSLIDSNYNVVFNAKYDLQDPNKTPTTVSVAQGDQTSNGFLPNAPNTVPTFTYGQSTPFFSQPIKVPSMSQILESLTTPITFIASIIYIAISKFPELSITLTFLFGLFIFDYIRGR